MRLVFGCVLAALALAGTSVALDNGLALTPPMGWMSWERFRCNIDCENDPLNCLSEELIKEQADQMVLKGFDAAGYEYVIIDDCWMNHTRDENGELQPDYDRFPSGMKALANYIQSIGLKFGIYTDHGNYTCAGYPGIYGHFEQDAQTFASWDVDYIKLDGCYSELEDMETGYPLFGQYLNDTGRPIVYSCSWPAYWETETPDYPAIQKSCNLWRNYADIMDSWASVLDIIDHYGDNQDVFADYAGPGNWNDPDMLIIGNFALSVEQSRTQMAVWAVLAAPLIMSNDLRNIDQVFVDILTNQNVINVNKDPLGHQGRRVKHDTQTHIDIFVKETMPTYDNYTSAAAAIMYRGVDGTPVKVTFTPEELGLTYPGGYIVTEVFEGTNLAILSPTGSMDVYVNPSGVQLLSFELNTKRGMAMEAEAAEDDEIGQIFSNEIPPLKQRFEKDEPEELEKKREFKVQDMGMTGWKYEL